VLKESEMWNGRKVITPRGNFGYAYWPTQWASNRDLMRFTRTTIAAPHEEHVWVYDELLPEGHYLGQSGASWLYNLADLVPAPYGP